jgi:hypothetical protein
MTAGANGRDSGGEGRRFPRRESRSRWLYEWIWLFLSFIAVGGTADGLKAQTTVSRPGLVLKILVYNSAGTSQWTLSRAEAVAGRILGGTGVEVAWMDCLAARGHLPAPESASGECGNPVSGATLVLQILPRFTPAKAAFGDTVFGYAEGSAWIRVFCDRIENYTRNENGDRRDIPVILGHIIAHETGHLLLGSASHSASGIMSANWDPSTLQRAITGRLLFSPAQSDRIRDEVLKRSE